MDDRTLADIVGTRFETQTQNAHALPASFFHQFNAALNLPLIARQNGAEQRTIDVTLFRTIHQSAQVFRQARSSESKPGHEIGRGNIEFAVAAKKLHDFTAVDSVGRAKIADFVREGDLHGVECVVHILQHFGSLDGRSNDGRLNRLIQVLHALTAACIEFADDDLAGMIVVFNGAAFPQKLRIRTQPKIIAPAPARMLF